MNVDELSIEYFPDIAESVAQAKNIYHQWGCFVAKGLLNAQELFPIQNELTQLIDLLRKQANLPLLNESKTRFDNGFLELVEHNSKFSSVIYNACRRLTSVHQLSVASKFLDLSQQLMQTNLVMSNPYKTVRIDFQQRENYLLPWHQDYPYVQDSPDALIYWIPLHDVNEEGGCMMIAPGSHQQGILSVKMNAPTSCVKDLQLADTSVVEKYPHTLLPVKMGDVVVFSTLLLHSSRPNMTELPRWTLQIRHGNFENPFSVQKHWPGSHYEQSWFDDSHPEYVIS